MRKRLQTVRNRSVLSIALAFVCVGALGFPVAAEPRNESRTVRGSNLYISRGVNIGEAVRQTAGGGLYARTVRADLRDTGVQLLPVVAADGPWSTESAADVLAREQAWSALAIDLPPRDGDNPFPRGPLFVGGTLHAWPGEPTVLIGGAEGTLAFDSLEDPGTGVVILPGGQPLVLSSVNGPPAENAVALYSGTYDGRSPATGHWPEETMALPLRPAPANNRPAAAIWDATLEPAERAWLPGSMRALRDLRLAAGEWALVVPPSLAEDEREALGRARSVMIEIDLPRRMALSTFVVPVDRLMMEAGDAIEPEEDVSPEAMRVVLALDDSGRRAWLVETGGESRGEFSFESRELAGILRREEATRAVELPHGSRYRLVPRRDERSARVDPRQVQGRAFLLVADRPQRLFLGDGDTEGLERLQVGYVTASNARATVGRPEALFDGQTAGGRSLEHFWAAPLEEDMTLERRPHRASDSALQWAEWRLIENARIAAVDLIHAEEAGFSPEFNLRSYRLMARFEGTRGEWVVLTEVRHDEPVPRERIRIRDRRRVETMRLEVLEPNFLPAGETARLAEIVLWGRR